MPIEKKIIPVVAGLLFVCSVALGQTADSVAGKVTGFPARVLGRLQSKTAGLDKQLTRQTERYLQKMARQEEKIRKKLYGIDSAGAKELFAGSAKQYAALEQRLKTDTGGRLVTLRGPYQPYVDSMQASLSFLQKNPSIAGTSADVQKTLQGSVGQFQQLEAKMQDADQIKQYLQQRKAQLQQYLQRYTHLPPGVMGAVAGYKQQAYYYSQQLQTYKEELNDPDKLMKRALQVLNKVPAYTDFVKRNSMLASLLQLPSGGSSSVSGASVTGQGMPTRDEVLAALPGAQGASGPNVTAALQQNVQSAQGQVDGIRDKLAGMGNSSGGDLDVPDFKPNGQRTRSFLRRLELGTNIQSTGANRFFPTVTDLGVSLGYRLNDKNVIGIGASYKIGWGNDIRHISMSGQGVGLRSFVDLQVKKSWFATGGFEYNYQQPFPIQGVPGLESWQKSGLIGVTKIISMQNRVFKKTKFQLLWDFLSYQQAPPTPHLKFRLGYSF